MGDDLVTRLLPVLSEPSAREFNLFDVLHHGTHEKQISNLFAWLLDPEETHHLGQGFQRIFIDQINHSLPEDRRVQPGLFSVRQEVNTSPHGESADIADLVLESESAVIVIENFHVSDGHGHSFRRYREFGIRDGKHCVVAMLSAKATPGALTDGWQDAALITYASVIEPLARKVESDQDYRLQYPHQFVLFEQMRQRYAKGLHVNDADLTEFVRAVCASGDAGHYRQSPETSAVNFADMLRERALNQFAESRELLGRVKSELRAYCTGPLRRQVNHTLGAEYLLDATANYRGIYQWTINFHTIDQEPDARPPVQIKFGPSAWYAIIEDDDWDGSHEEATADYAYLFWTHAESRLVKQSAVTMSDLLAGIASDDLRLHDEVVSLLSV